MKRLFNRVICALTDHIWDQWPNRQVCTRCEKIEYKPMLVDRDGVVYPPDRRVVLRGK